MPTRPSEHCDTVATQLRSWQPSLQVRAAGLSGFHYPGQGVDSLRIQSEIGSGHPVRCVSRGRRHKVVSEGTSPFMQAMEAEKARLAFGLGFAGPCVGVPARGGSTNGVRVEGLPSEISRPQPSTLPAQLTVWLQRTLRILSLKWPPPTLKHQAAAEQLQKKAFKREKKRACHNLPHSTRR